MAGHDIITLIKHHNIQGIASNAQSLQTGQMFFALRGVVSDGSQFIDMAINMGASLVVTDTPAKIRNSKVIVVTDIKLVLQQALDYLYPNLPKHLVAVTGTNGKTSVVNYFQQLCMLTGVPAASIGTLGIITTDAALNAILRTQYPIEQTTMGLIELRKVLHHLATHNIDLVAIEASSHGISQGRLQNIKFQTAAFTNIGHDHLDYHQNMEDYINAKLKLFQENMSEQATVVMEEGVIDVIPKIQDKLVSEYGLKLMTVGDQGTIIILRTESSLNEQKVLFKYEGKCYNFVVPIICKFQITNIFVALLLAKNVGLDVTHLISVLPKLQPVEGRLQHAQYGNRHVFVDYAHNPDGLEVMLREVKAILPQNAKLIIIFGGGGQRDKQKRSIMGMIATKFANLVVVTDDSPRNEDASLIRKEILRAAPKAIEVAGREAAIKYGIEAMEENDILVISGRGHEKYQTIGNKKIYFKDIEKVNFYMQQIHSAK